MGRFIAMLVLVALANEVSAQGVPQVLTFSARLARDGQTGAGPVQLQAALFDAEQGGERLWEERSVEVMVDEGGVITHELGHEPASAPLDGELFDGRPIYLELRVDGVLLRPRLPVLSVPHAHYAAWAERAEHAEQAQSLGSLSADQVALAAHHHDGRYVSTRAATSCEPQNLATGVLANGALECGSDADTRYTAGTGLRLSGNQFGLTDAGLGSELLAPAAVGPEQIPSRSVPAAALEDGVIHANHVIEDSIESRSIAKQVLDRSKLVARGIPLYLVDKACHREANAGSQPRFGVDEQLYGVLSIDPTCVTTACSGDSFHVCNELGATCTGNAAQVCSNDLYGYLAPP